jgi:murein DD-endopeptidase MepM/ murein hydrolase activator NlpD
VPTRYRRSTPLLDLPRHRGFLGVKRRTLAFGSLATSALLMSIPALPASADVVVAEVEITNLQTFAAPAFVPVPLVERDAFGVTVFSLVQWPVPAATTMTSDYGYRDCSGCSSDHKGIDLTPGDGYPIQSVADGVVVLSDESDSGLGVHVVVEHVIDGQKVQTVYAHMQFGSRTVAVGDTVARGQQLGVVGNTGASTGPHLHFEVIIDEIQINPLEWLLLHANM